MRKQLIFSLLLTALSSNVSAAPFTIDGNLSDWGVSQNGNASDWIPHTGILHTIEDQNTDKLDPGYGGQAYDAEAIYAYKDRQATRFPLLWQLGTTLKLPILGEIMVQEILPSILVGMVLLK